MISFSIILLSYVNLCFAYINDITLANNNNLWGLLQTELEVSKFYFIFYKIILLLLISALLFMAYKNTRTRTIILVFFVLCNVFMPFNIMENLLFGI